ASHCSSSIELLQQIAVLLSVRHTNNFFSAVRNDGNRSEPWNRTATRKLRRRERESSAALALRFNSVDRVFRLCDLWNQRLFINIVRRAANLVKLLLRLVFQVIQSVDCVLVLSLKMLILLHELR